MTHPWTIQAMQHLADNLSKTIRTVGKLREQVRALENRVKELEGKKK